MVSRKPAHSVDYAGNIYTTVEEQKDTLFKEQSEVPARKQGAALEYARGLAEAAASGSMDELRWLLNHQPTLSAALQQDIRYAALFGALATGQHAACQILLEHDNPSKTALHLPSCSKNTSRSGSGRNDLYPIKYLSFLELAYTWPQLKPECNQNEKTDGHYLGMLGLCLEYGVRCASEAGLTLQCRGLLSSILLNHDVAAMQLLVQYGLDVNAEIEGHTLLRRLLRTFSARWSDVEPAVMFLLEAGADPVTLSNCERETWGHDVYLHIGTLMQDALKPKPTRKRRRNDAERAAARS